MIDWRAKLTSRKFWLAVVGFISGVLVAFKVDAQTTETISGIVMAGASIIAYIIGEGLADAAGAGQPFTYVETGHVNVDTDTADVSIDKADVSKEYVGEISK